MGHAFVFCLIAVSVMLGSGATRADDAKAAAKPAAAATTTFTRNYRVFYVVTEGAGNTAINSTVQAYLPLALAQTITSGWISKPPLPIHRVAALGWGAADLASSCSDPMVAGGLLITYTSWTTDNFWVAYNAEKFYVTANMSLVSCANQTATIVYETPLSSDKAPSNLLPFHSHGRITVPIAPLAALSSLFGPKDQGGLTAVPSAFYHASEGYYILVTAFSKTSGNIGGINTEKEAREVSDQIATVELPLVPTACDPTKIDRKDEVASFETLTAMRTKAAKEALLRAGATPSPRPSKATPKPMPTPTPEPPLATLCKALGNPVASPSPAPSPAPLSGNGFP